MGTHCCGTSAQYLRFWRASVEGILGLMVGCTRYLSQTDTLCFCGLMVAHAAVLCSAVHWSSWSLVRGNGHLYKICMGCWADAIAFDRDGRSSQHSFCWMRSMLPRVVQAGLITFKSAHFECSLTSCARSSAHHFGCSSVSCVAPSLKSSVRSAFCLRVQQFGV